MYIPIINVSKSAAVMYYDSFCKTYLRFMTTQERVIMTEVMVLIKS